MGNAGMCKITHLTIIMLLGAILTGCATGSPSVSGSASEQGVSAKATVAAAKF